MPKKSELPCPDKVEIPPMIMSMNGPSFFDRPFWQSLRHFILGFVAVGGTALATSGGNWIAALGAAVSGGVAAASRKRIDDKRRAEGKDDIITVIGKFLSLLIELLKMWKNRKESK